MFGRIKVATIAAEFLGTAILAMTILSMAGRTSFPFFAAVAAGIAYGVLVLIFGGVSGVHLNPAVTVGAWVNRKIRTLDGIVYIAAQFAGGAVAWQLSEYMLNQPLPNVAGELDWNVLVAQAVGAFVLVLALTAATAKAFDNVRTAAVAGLALTVGYMVASLTASSNGIINPAVAIGMQSWGWSYALGPVAGAVVGVVAYNVFFVERTRTARSKVAATKSVKKTTKRTTAKKKK